MTTKNSSKRKKIILRRIDKDGEDSMRDAFEAYKIKAKARAKTKTEFGGSSSATSDQSQIFVSQMVRKQLETQ